MNWMYIRVGCNLCNIAHQRDRDTQPVPCNWRIVDAVSKQNISLKQRICYRCRWTVCLAGWLLAFGPLSFCLSLSMTSNSMSISCILTSVWCPMGLFTWVPCKQCLNVENAKTNPYKSAAEYTQKPNKKKPRFRLSVNTVLYECHSGWLSQFKLYIWKLLERKISSENAFRRCAFSAFQLFVNEHVH